MHLFRVGVPRFIGEFISRIGHIGFHVCAAFVIAGDGLAFPEARGAICGPMVWEGLAVGEGSVSEWAAPLRPVGGAGEREGARGEECEEEGGA